VATPLPTLTVRFRVTGPDPVTLTLVGERVTPLGAPTRERETVPVKPFWGVMVRVVVLLPPCWMPRLAGLREMVKLGELPPPLILQAANTSNSAANNPAP
jgi:hypothetical protein